MSSKALLAHGGCEGGLLGLADWGEHLEKMEGFGEKKGTSGKYMQIYGNFHGNSACSTWYGKVWNEVFPTFLEQTRAALYVF